MPRLNSDQNQDGESLKKKFWTLSNSGAPTDDHNFPEDARHAKEIEDGLRGQLLMMQVFVVKQMNNSIVHRKMYKREMKPIIQLMCM